MKEEIIDTIGTAFGAVLYILGSILAGVLIAAVIVIPVLGALALLHYLIRKP